MKAGGEPVARAWKVLRRHVADAQRHVEAARMQVVADAGGAPTDRAVHGARKSLKRARAFAQLLAPALGGPVASAIDRRARDVGRALAPLRDAVAAGAALESVRARAGGDAGLDAAAWEAIARACGAVDVPPAHRGVAATALLDSAAAELTALRALLRTTGKPEPSTAAWARGLRALHRTARRAARVALEAPDDDELVHAARSKWKRLGFAVRAYRAAAPELVRPWVAEVEAVGALLGDDHDQVLVRERLGTGVDGVPEEALERLRAASQGVGAALRSEALARLARLAAEPSKGFAARHRAYVAPD